MGLDSSRDDAVENIVTHAYSIKWHVSFVLIAQWQCYFITDAPMVFEG